MNHAAFDNGWKYILFYKLKKELDYVFLCFTCLVCSNSLIAKVPQEFPCLIQKEY